MEDNIPFGYGDPKNTNDTIRFGGPANCSDEEDRARYEKFKNAPQTPDEADAWYRKNKGRVLTEEEQKRILGL